MEKDYLDLNSGELESIDTNLPLSDENDIKNFELEDIEKTLRNINLSYLNDSNELIEKNGQDIIAPKEEEPVKLFDEPKKEELEFNMPILSQELPVVENKEEKLPDEFKSEENKFNFSPLINSMVKESIPVDNLDAKEDFSYSVESKEESLDIIADIEKNRDIILAEINKINNEVIIPAQESGITNSDYLKESVAKSQIISAASKEFETLINNFVAKVKQNNVQFENSEELSTFRI